MAALGVIKVEVSNWSKPVAINKDYGRRSQSQTE